MASINDSESILKPFMSTDPANIDKSYIKTKINLKAIKPFDTQRSKNNTNLSLIEAGHGTTRNRTRMKTYDH